MFTTRALLEARGPILILLVLSGAGVVCSWWAALIPIALLLPVLLFFRDPERRIPGDPNVIVSPADGTVVEVAQAREDLFMKSAATRVAVFLSVFDVHVQRAPVGGEIMLVQRGRGTYLDARDPRAGAMNENRSIGIEAGDGFRVLVRQIAGKVARRIVGWEETGTTLAKGQRVGMIRFGSRVELYMPPGVEVSVSPGQRVKGGETIVARRK